MWGKKIKPGRSQEERRLRILFYLETGSHCAVRAGLELVAVLLLQPPECYDYTCGTISQESSLKTSIRNIIDEEDAGKGISMCRSRHLIYLLSKRQVPSG